MKPEIKDSNLYFAGQSRACCHCTNPQGEKSPILTNGGSYEHFSQNEIKPVNNLNQPL